jgi:hypothetical protein
VLLLEFRAFSTFLFRRNWLPLIRPDTLPLDDDDMVDETSAGTTGG